MHHTHSTAEPLEARQPAAPATSARVRRGPLSVAAPGLTALIGAEHTQVLHALARLLPEPEVDDVADSTELPEPTEVSATLDRPEPEATSAA